MLHDPAEWARLCRRQAAIASDRKVSDLLKQLADKCDALAEQLAESNPFGESQTGAGESEAGTD